VSEADEPRRPEDWTREEWAALQADLDELEATDPDVATAAESYARAVERILGRDRA
jgi:hypothetical protein